MISKIETDGGFWISLALSLLLIPLKWVLAWITAAFIHEVFHIVMLRAFRCEMISVKLGAFGAKIESGALSDWAAILSAAAGPVASLLLVLVARWLPNIAICGFIQGFFNLLPLFPMDGWHIMERVKSYHHGALGSAIAVAIRVCISIALLVLGVILLLNACGPLPLIAAIVVILKDLKNSLQKRL